MARETLGRVNKVTELTRRIWACKQYTMVNMQLFSAIMHLKTNQSRGELNRLKDNSNYNKDKFSPSNPTEGADIIKVLSIIKIH